MLIELLGENAEIKPDIFNYQVDVGILVPNEPIILSTSLLPPPPFGNPKTVMTRQDNFLGPRVLQEADTVKRQ